MKITIDTKEDSHDEIRKVIDILTSLVKVEDPGQEVVINKPVEEISEDSSNAFANVFSSVEPEKKEDDDENIDINVYGVEKFFD